MSAGWFIAGSVLVGAGLLASCSGSSVDVTNSAGDPVAEASVPRSGEAATPQEAAPSCPERLRTSTDDGLVCLGPGPAIDVFDVPGVVVVPVWASWCGPCREELPVLQSFYETGADVIGIAAADNSSAAANLAQELSLSFPSVQDPESTTRATLGWSGLPATFLLRDGEVVGRITGQVKSEDQLRQAVRDAQEG